MGIDRRGDGRRRRVRVRKGDFDTTRRYVNRIDAVEKCPPRIGEGKNVRLVCFNDISVRCDHYWVQKSIDLLPF